MNHDLLCPSAYTMLCECNLIAKVRQDMLAKCIAGVEAAFDKCYEPVWVAEVTEVLRALEEKP